MNLCITNIKDIKYSSKEIFNRLGQKKSVIYRKTNDDGNSSETVEHTSIITIISLMIYSL